MCGVWNLYEKCLSMFNNRIMACEFQVANMIRFLVDSYNKPIPAILEIPSKDHPYDPTQDSVLSRVKYLFSAESVASGRRWSAQSTYNPFPALCCLVIQLSSSYCFCFIPVVQMKLLWVVAGSLICNKSQNIWLGWWDCELDFPRKG